MTDELKKIRDELAITSSPFEHHSFGHETHTLGFKDGFDAAVDAMQARVDEAYDMVRYLTDKCESEHEHSLKIQKSNYERGLEVERLRAENAELVALVETIKTFVERNNLFKIEVEIADYERRMNQALRSKGDGE